ncbi:aldehyde dehydrogenase family protein [Agrobacterium rubi]|uniref:Aldehyde dehydrogenase family protein n=1 Tax=Agrobacterium rubi TaxID=28099 RepID=A0AAE7QZH1_9HYPH|nr:aldehyde dehydrogenase family protein [Agrobacterium rubi]NTE86864.1 aldehyde dehydrogenase family protein [Agrobacterium rubi]NTF37042.1 aldehyde dehydrogenase family protein [Agrobacterium rubi]OCJ55362.1 aldehyde dehydrogenase [Agrobacterium rubi]QTF99477.1 aldehyde dehydrogenase family protein [Agrobacterium rubi]
MVMIQNISPIDGSVFAEREAMSLDAARAAVLKVRAAQKSWARRPLEDRVQLVLKGVARLNEMVGEVVPELAHMMGRPVRYGGEFKGFNERSNYVASIAADALAPLVIEESGNFERRIEREAHGVVFVIAPWNYPYMTAINTIAPALMAGNTVVIKHAAQTLLVGERMVRAFVEAGVPEDVFINLFLDHQTTSALIAESLFNFVNFTGSVEGGRAIERATAGTFTGLGLELGGKDPGYVMEDADLDAAVDTLMDGATFNSGQCCCGIERVYVNESLFDAFVEKSVAWVSNYKLGNPLEQETSLGPMANKRFAKVVRQQVADAVSKGAKALVDPKLFAADDGESAYVAPQILVNVDHSMEFMTEETFGPAVGIMKVKNDDEAITLMNDSKYGLTASLWTQDAERAGRIGREIETGTVFMNRADYLDPALCWTGVKDTGRGGSLSVIGFQNLTRPKSYHLKKVTK